MTQFVLSVFLVWSTCSLLAQTPSVSYGPRAAEGDTVLRSLTVYFWTPGKPYHYAYGAVDTVVDLSKTSTQRQTYTSSGKLATLSLDRYYPDGTPSAGADSIAYYYDQRDSLTLEVQHNYWEGDGYRYDSTRYVRDTLGRVVEEHCTSTAGKNFLTHSTRFTYLNDGRLATELELLYLYGRLRPSHRRAHTYIDSLRRHVVRDTFISGASQIPHSVRVDTVTYSPDSLQRVRIEHHLPLNSPSGKTWQHRSEVTSNRCGDCLFSLVTDASGDTLDYRHTTVVGDCKRPDVVTFYRQGRSPRREEFTYQYGAGGRLLERRTRTDGKLSEVRWYQARYW